MDTTTITPAMHARLDALNALPRRKGFEVCVTRDDLLSLEQAKAAAGKDALADWSPDSVFIRVASVVGLYRACTRKGRMALLEDEMFGGWFAEQGGDDCDADGEFCSTPSHNVDDAPISIAEFEEDLDHCSANGVLFLY